MLWAPCPGRLMSANKATRCTADYLMAAAVCSRLQLRGQILAHWTFQVAIMYIFIITMYRMTMWKQCVTLKGSLMNLQAVIVQISSSLWLYSSSCWFWAHYAAFQALNFTVSVHSYHSRGVVCRPQQAIVLTEITLKSHCTLPAQYQTADRHR